MFAVGSRIGFRWIAAMFGMAAAMSSAAQWGGDLQARILYAYQTEDLDSLTDLMQSLAAQVKAQGGDWSLRYQLAHADYRFAELARDSKPAAAEAALADCTERLDSVIEHDRRSAEPLILDSACRAELAERRKVQGMLLRAQAESQLTAAQRLDPQNPRLLLLRARNSLARAKPGTAQSAEAFALLKRSAERFEQTPATDTDTPGWGHADAYLALGREYMLRGDTLAARNWLEKALIAAPDFKAAQRQLATLRQG